MPWFVVALKFGCRRAAPCLGDAQERLMLMTTARGQRHVDGEELEQ